MADDFDAKEFIEKIQKEANPKKIQERKNKYIEAYDHSTTKVKDEAGLKRYDAIKRFSEFMMHYDSKSGHLHEDMIKDDHTKERYMFLAKSQLERMAGRDGNLDSVVANIEKNGFSEVFATYHKSQLKEVEERIKSLAYEKHGHDLKLKHKEKIRDELSNKVSELKLIKEHRPDDYIMAAHNIEAYLRGHMDKLYDVKPYQKPEEKKKAA